MTNRVLNETFYVQAEAGAVMKQSDKLRVHFEVVATKESLQNKLASIINQPPMLEGFTKTEMEFDSSDP